MRDQGFRLLSALDNPKASKPPLTICACPRPSEWPSRTMLHPRCRVLLAFIHSSLAERWSEWQGAICGHHRKLDDLHGENIQEKCFPERLHLLEAIPQRKDWRTLRCRIPGEVQIKEFQGVTVHVVDCTCGDWLRCKHA